MNQDKFNELKALYIKVLRIQTLTVTALMRNVLVFLLIFMFIAVIFEFVGVTSTAISFGCSLVLYFLYVILWVRSLESRNRKFVMDYTNYVSAIIVQSYLVSLIFVWIFPGVEPLRQICNVSATIGFITMFMTTMECYKYQPSLEDASRCKCCGRNSCF